MKQTYLSLDLAKVFESNSWTLVLGTMNSMGFGGTIIKFVERCISTPSFSMLVEGEPKSQFRSGRALR